MAVVIDPRVDLYLTGDWLDITSVVRQDPPITVTGGTKNEASSISPSQCKFSVNNSSGDYNPRNPIGQYFGELGKNTPVRVRVPLLTDNVSETDTDGWGAKWDNGPSSGGTVADTDYTRSGTTNTHSVPVANAYRRSLLKATNSYWDSCVRTRLTLPTSNITGAKVINEVNLRYVDANNYVSVLFHYNTDETIEISIIEKIAGTDRSLLAETTITGLSVATDQSFEIAVLIEGQVVRAKIWAFGDPEPADWTVFTTRATCRSGRTGLVSVIDPSNSNTKPFAFVYNNTTVEARPFVGEISEYVPKVSDESHAAPYVEITASGITKRTDQGSEPLKSPLFRWWSSDQRWIREGAAVATVASDVNTLKVADADAADVAVGNFFRLMPFSSSGIGSIKEDQLFTVTSKSSSGGVTDINFTPDASEATVIGNSSHTLRLATATDNPIAYWPCEDDKNATSIASGLLGGAPMQYRLATPDFGSKDTAMGSAPFLKLNNAELFADIPDYTDTNQAFTIHILFDFPATDEAATSTDILQFYTTGTAESWDVQFDTGGGGGDLTISAADVGGAGVLFSNSYDLDMRNRMKMVTLTVEQTGGSTVAYTITSVGFNNDGTFSEGGSSPNTATATGVTTLGKITKIRINPGGGYVDVGVGHIGVIPAAFDYFNFVEPAKGYAGEETIRRMIRLPYEEDIPFVYCGGSVPAAIMGVQKRDTVLNNMQDGAIFDLGRFHEARGAYSFVYRSRSTLYSQTPFLTVDYSAGGVLSELVPADDDKDTRNDVTVKRSDGSFFRATQDTGRLSVLKPSDGGVGRYTDSVDVNAAEDGFLSDIAGWLLHLGTVDEERYPSIKLTPVNSSITLAQLFSAGVGNRFKLTDLDARGVYEPIDQLVLGYTLILHPYVPTLELNGEPASPYNVATLDDSATRLDSDTSTLNEDLTTTETGVDVATTGGTLWVTTATDSAEFPFDIMVGGERMTVTACTGSSSPQTFTVTRSVNGVVKTHATGAQAMLADPVYLPL